MRDQTNKLCQALPNFASLFAAADERNSAQWQIVRWEDIRPENVKPEQVRPISDSLEHRTHALRKSAELATVAAGGKSNRTQKDHWGVWKWAQGGKTVYQSVKPILAQQVSAAGNGTDGKNGSTSALVRVSEDAYKMLRKWAEEERTTLQAVLDRAIKEYDRQRFFAKADAAYKALRNDPAAWQEELQERAEWDATLLDDLRQEETWPNAETAASATRKERASA